MTTLADLPRFTLLALSHEPDGWVLQGSFELPSLVVPGPGFLYNDGTGFMGEVTALAPTGIASISTSDPIQPPDWVALGSVFPWVGGPWRPEHLAWVLDRSRRWNERPSEYVNETCFVCRRALGWDGGPAGGYADQEGHAACRRCVRRYVSRGDLAFVRELAAQL